jgi:hypothetical protein
LTKVSTSLQSNLQTFYRNLPETSIIKSSVIQTLFHDIESKDISEYLDIEHRRVNRANLVEVEPLNFYLKELGFTREKTREEHLLDWLEEVAPFESGRTKRYFTWTGTIHLMYSKYLLHCKQDNDFNAYSLQKFSQIVQHERIGIHSGDVFYDSVKIKFNQMKEEKKAGKIVNEEELKSLEEQYNFNNSRKKMLRKFVQDLKGHTKTVLVILDFSQLQISLTRNFHTFVIVIISDEVIDIPEDLKDFIIIAEKPKTMTEIPEIEEKEKRLRSKKKEKDPNTQPFSFTEYKTKEKKKRKLSEPEIQLERYSPHHLHIHFAMEKTPDAPGQVAPFVYRGLQILFNSGMNISN